MRLSGMDAATQFVNEKFPHCDIALLAGSASRGEETTTSDLDIVVFDKSIENQYRESFEMFHWKIETFFHNYKSYLYQFELDKETGRPILANMIVEGKAIRDNGKSEEIKSIARNFIRSGPRPLTEDFIRASRYFIYDLLDDFNDSISHAEAIITINTISTQLAEFILRVNGHWTGRGKGLARALRKFDEAIYSDFFQSLDCYYKDGNKQPFIRFVNDIYEPFGGPLFGGFSQGK